MPKLLLFSGAILLCLLVAQAVGAQEIELAYDDGNPEGTLSSLTAGDIELTRLTPDHPAVVRSLRLHFATVGCHAHIFIWADNGGNAADTDQILYETEMDIDAEGWHEVEVPAEAVTLDPPQRFYLGHLLEGDLVCQLSWDSSGVDEGRSLARIGGGWYSIVDGGDPPRPIDALLRATVGYFDVLEERTFEEVTLAAVLPEGMGRMAWGDYDDDGDDDLLVSGNQLFRNNGDGSFEEVAEEAGIGDHPTNSGLWGDYDGVLDFYGTVHNYLPECESDVDCVWCTFSFSSHLLSWFFAWGGEDEKRETLAICCWLRSPCAAQRVLGTRRGGR